MRQRNWNGLASSFKWMNNAFLVLLYTIVISPLCSCQKHRVESKFRQIKMYMIDSIVVNNVNYSDCNTSTFLMVEADRIKIDQGYRNCPFYRNSNINSYYDIYEWSFECSDAGCLLQLSGQGEYFSGMYKYRFVRDSKTGGLRLVLKNNRICLSGVSLWNLDKSMQELFDIARRLNSNAVQ